MPLIHRLITIKILQNQLNEPMQDPNTTQRFPITDDMDDYFLPMTEHEDLVSLV